MSVNEEHVQAGIREINDAVQMLRDLTGRVFEDLTIHERLSTRYLVIQLVESASSICMHILLSLYNEKVEGFPECFVRLGDKGIIPKDLASTLSSAARLRNLLVHRYWVIVDEKVFESARKGLNDFEGFVVHVSAFLEKRAKT